MHNYFLAKNFSALKLDTPISELQSAEIGPCLGTDEWIFSGCAGNNEKSLMKYHARVRNFNGIP